MFIYLHYKYFLYIKYVLCDFVWFTKMPNVHLLYSFNHVLTHNSVTKYCWEILPNLWQGRLVNLYCLRMTWHSRFDLTCYWMCRLHTCRPRNHLVWSRGFWLPCRTQQCLLPCRFCHKPDPILLPLSIHTSPYYTSNAYKIQWTWWTYMRIVYIKRIIYRKHFALRKRPIFLLRYWVFKYFTFCAVDFEDVFRWHTLKLRCCSNEDWTHGRMGWWKS